VALDLRKFTERFIEEARERIATLNEGIRAIDGAISPDGTTAAGDERQAEARGTIDDMFRAVHTIKGSAKMLGQTGIGETAHRLEDLLDALRKGAFGATPRTTKALYRGADGLAGLVERLAKGEEKPPADEATIAALADCLAQALPEAGPSGAPPAPLSGPGPGADSPRRAPSETARPSDSVRVRVEKLDELVRLAGETIAAQSLAARRIDELTAIGRMSFPASIGDAERLRLLRERIGHFRRALRADLLSRQNLESELHGAALAMRMLPLSIVFEPAARMAREIALSLGKEIDCVVSGSDIELDRQIIDRLGEPILHLLRNAIDHGIEEPADRAKAGKAPRGRIELSAKRTEASVVIEVGDDGGGLPIEAIRDKAVRMHAVSADKAAALSARELTGYIFLPGFSTSPIVTDLSGRGVGLDAVRKTVVEGLKGNVTVDSAPGAGVRFQLKLPPTLAVMRVLFARSGGSVFAFDAHDVTGVVDIGEESLIDIAGKKAAVIRDEFVPVVSLEETLKVPAAPGRGKRAHGGLRLVVVNDGSERLALAIDELIDERETVVKPMPAHMRSISLVSGVVTDGANELVCLLNAPALVGDSRASRSAVAGAGPEAAETHPAEILIVDDSLNTREIERDVLEAHGYRITLAEDGLAGLAMAMERRFDAVLTDVEMPGMDGFVLTERLRAEEAYRDTPIVILTSRSRDEDRRKGMRAGADAYIVKGDFEQESLLETLRGLGL